MVLRALVLACVLFAATGSASGILAARPPAHFAGGDLVRVRIVAEARAVAPGGSTWLDVELDPSPGWHVYWRNPGDAGEPPTFSWSLPPGVEAGNPLWPAPESLATAGTVTYVYRGRTSLLVPVSVGRDVPSGEVVLRATISWAACAHVCVPGQTVVNAHLAVVAADAPREPLDAPPFAAARARLPQRAVFPVTFSADRARLRVAVPRAAVSGRVERAYFFPLDGTLIAQSAPQVLSVGKSVTLTLRRAPQGRVPAQLDGVLALETSGPDGRREQREYAVSAKQR